MKKEAQYDVVWPSGRSGVESIDLSPRAFDLNGKTVCELWDSVFRGEEIFPIIREKLREHFTDITIVEYHKFGNFHGPQRDEVLENLPALLQKYKCDAVICGIGA